jgi:hypothetical protein
MDLQTSSGAVCVSTLESPTLFCLGRGGGRWYLRWMWPWFGLWATQFAQQTDACGSQRLLRIRDLRWPCSVNFHWLSFMFSLRIRINIISCPITWTVYNASPERRYLSNLHISAINNCELIIQSPNNQRIRNNAFQLSSIVQEQHMEISTSEVLRIQFESDLWNACVDSLHGPECLTMNKDSSERFRAPWLERNNALSTIAPSLPLPQVHNYPDIRQWTASWKRSFCLAFSALRFPSHSFTAKLASSRRFGLAQPHKASRAPSTGRIYSRRNSIEESATAWEAKGFGTMFRKDLIIDDKRRPNVINDNPVTKFHSSQ